MLEQLRTLRTLFGAAEKPVETEAGPEPAANTPPPLAPPTAPETHRAAALVSIELAQTREFLERLPEKLAAAEERVAASRGQYEAAVEDSVFGRTTAAPDRVVLRDALEHHQALLGLSESTPRRILNLESELAAARARESEAAGLEKVPLLAAVAEARLVEFLEGAAAQRKREADLFSSLFDEATGLKQYLPSAAEREARRIRFGLARRAIDGALAQGYNIHPNYETDGNQNLGREQAARFNERYAAATWSARAGERLAAAERR